MYWSKIVSLIKFFHPPSHNLFQFFKQICHPWQPHRSSLNFSLKIGAGYGRRREEEMGHVCGVDPNIKSLNAFLPQIHWKGKWCTDSYFIWWNSLLVIRDHLMTNDLKYLWISTLVTAVILKAEVKVEKGEQYSFSLILFYQTVTDLLPLLPVRLSYQIVCRSVSFSLCRSLFV